MSLLSDTATPQETRPKKTPSEAKRGLWQRISYRRALAEGAIIYILWRLLFLIPITFWPTSLFPFILVGLLLLQFTPPVWVPLRIIATKREKMSRRFFSLALLLASICAILNALISLFIGDSQQPFGGPAFGPDLARFSANVPHHLTIGAFAQTALTTWGLLLVYYLMGVICTRLAQGGFLRFTMPSGDGRVTL
jgi:hypothetical protein